MKTIIFSALLLFTSAAVISGESNYSSNILTFETSDGKTLYMETYEEREITDDIPDMLKPLIHHDEVNIENHAYFQALVKSLQKPETEDALPFELN